jgi:hypothetical protein
MHPQKQNNSLYTAGHVALQTLAGWTAPYQPKHHALEAEALELEDIRERDAAARAVFARRVVQ